MGTQVQQAFNYLFGSDNFINGVWQDYSQGIVFGRVLTLSTQSGGYIITLLTTLITIAGSFAWIITAFFLHSARVREMQPDLKDAQRQIVLRNSGSPLGTLWQFHCVNQAWKKARKARTQGVYYHIDNRATRRGWCARQALWILPILIWLLFKAAGILVANVQLNKNGTNKARMEPKDCGFVNFNLTNDAGQSAFNSRAVRITQNARSNAQAQLLGTSGNTLMRSIFPTEKLSFADDNVTCPFGANRCKDVGYALATPLLDSRSMFGINAPDGESVSFATKITCAPINIADYAKVIHPVTAPNTTFIQYNLGPIVGVSNWTYQYNIETLYDNIAYGFVPIFTLAGAKDPSWLPVAPFQRNDSDVTIIFKSDNSVAYQEPVLDPWFFANGSYTIGDGVFNDPLYLSNNYVNVMACMQSYQLHNPTNSFSGDYGGFNALLSSVTSPSLNFTLAQQATAYRLCIAMKQSTLYQSFFGLGGAALLAQSLLVNLVSPGLPIDHWKSEVQLWFATSMYKLQSYMLELTSSKPNLGPYASVNPASAFGPAMEAACQTQLVRISGDATTFSFFGILFTVVACVFIISIGLSLEPLADKINERKRKQAQFGAPVLLAANARRTEGNLYMHARALDREGLRGWHGGDTSIPVIMTPIQIRAPAFVNELMHVTVKEGGVDLQEVNDEHIQPLASDMD